MSLQLRKADYADMDLLFCWVNDTTVRANAFHTDKIPYEDHVKWFERMMLDESVYQYILYEDEVPVGQIRLNVEGTEALIDYSIAADQRQKGYGSKMLQMIWSQSAADKISHVTKLVGQVKYENAASVRAFRKSGFSRKDMPGYIQFEKEM